MSIERFQDGIEKGVQLRAISEAAGKSSTSGGRHCDGLPTYYYRERGVTSGPAAAASDAHRERSVAPLGTCARGLFTPPWASKTAFRYSQDNRVSIASESAVIHRITEENTALIDQTQMCEDQDAAWPVRDLQAGGARHSGCAPDDCECSGDGGRAAISTGSVAAAGRAAAAGAGAPRQQAWLSELRDRLQHIEDLIADAIYDAELGNLTHRRQAEAVLAVLLARGLNTDALDLS